LEKIQTMAGVEGVGRYGNDPDSQEILTRVNSVYQFVTQWQDYLSARNNGNKNEAQNDLRNLSSRSVGDFLLVPRSELLSRINDLGSIPGQPSSLSPEAQSANEDTQLAKIQTLDDMAKILPSLSENSAVNSAQNLSRMVTIYSEVKSGLPVDIDLSPLNYFGGNVKPDIGRIKAMLLAYLLPKFIGPDAPVFSANQTVDDYLRQSMDAAEAKSDLPLLLRLLQAQLKCASVPPPPGSQSYMAGLSQEIAGQYSLAVGSYENALKNPDTFLPSKVVGERLDEIKKDHASDYADGMKSFLNPPMPTYNNPFFARPGFNTAPWPQPPQINNPITPPAKTYKIPSSTAPKPPISIPTSPAAPK
jgi:hypothetical protein